MITIEGDTKTVVSYEIEVDEEEKRKIKKVGMDVTYASQDVLCCPPLVTGGSTV